jgi:hypothetical protein
MAAIDFLESAFVLELELALALEIYYGISHAHFVRLT